MKINNKDYDINNIIEMAWCDKTSFDSIKFQTNLSEKEVIKIMRSNLKKSSFQIWREESTAVKLNMQKSEIQIVWFKRDLRTIDHKPYLKPQKL